MEHIIKSPGRKNAADVFQIVDIGFDELHILVNGFRHFGMWAGK